MVHDTNPPRLASKSLLVEAESSVRGAPNEIGAERVRALVRLHDPQPTRTPTYPSVITSVKPLAFAQASIIVSEFTLNLTKASGPKSSTVKARRSLQSVVGKYRPQGPSRQALLLSLQRIEFPASQRSSEICSGRSCRWRVQMIRHERMNQLYDPLVGGKDNEYPALSGATNALPAPQSMGDQPEGSWPAIVDLIFDIVRHRDRLALKRKALGRHKRRLARKHRRSAAR